MKDSKANQQQQDACRKLVSMDGGVLYASWLDDSGSTLCEAMNDSISGYDHLTVSTLPINGARSEFLVFATPPKCDLNVVIAKIRRQLFFSVSSQPAARIPPSKKTRKQVPDRVILT